MPRSLRNFHPGGIYHITHRGHNRYHIFEESTDKAVFLDILKKVLQETPGLLLYYVVMDNHYHFIFEMTGTTLDKIMHNLNMRYAQYYSNKNNLSGAIFCNRYSVTEVNGQKYLSNLIQYIAINPLKAGLVQKIGEYRWCSHLELVSRKQELIASQRLFELLGGTIDKGKSTYIEIIQEAQQKSEQFCNLDISTATRRMKALESQLNTFLASQNNKPTIHQLRSQGRDRLIAQSRRTFAQLAFQMGYRISEIAKVLNVSTRSIYEWCKDIKSPSNSQEDKES